MQFSTAPTASASYSEDTSGAGIGDRLHIQTLSTHANAPQDQDDANVVVQGLTQTPKTLPARFFYDDAGSQLFEQICDLPEYYLTRTETAILQACAEAIANLTGACELVELGSGSSTKTRILLDAYTHQNLPLRYIPIDVSAGILKETAETLLKDYASLKILGLVGTYQQALQQLGPSTLPSRMIAFIGSSLGNLPPAECHEFLGQIAAALQPGDYFLLGIDLQPSVDKSKAVLEAAYDDVQGVTAAFNLNMLRHLNRKFDGDFDLEQFDHVAFYHEERHQVEMHLRSRCAQTVHLKALDLTIDLAEGETIHTEISHKFDLDEMQAELRSHHLETVHVQTDPQHRFAVVLSQLQKH
ncbi:MAG: L-histidine N(alpha)-methyltransferase [Elainellaceae cyanobacterium]